jgi:hypothetical protein
MEKGLEVAEPITLPSSRKSTRRIALPEAGVTNAVRLTKALVSKVAPSAGLVIAIVGDTKVVG